MDINKAISPAAGDLSLQMRTPSRCTTFCKVISSRASKDSRFIHTKFKVRKAITLPLQAIPYTKKLEAIACRICYFHSQEGKQLLAKTEVKAFT